MIFTDWLEKWSVYAPLKTAVKLADASQEYTYAQLNHMANNLGHQWIKEYGLEKGDRIMVLAEFLPEYFPLLGLAQKIGIILVPVNYRLAASEISFLVEDAEPKLIIVEEKFENLIHGSQSKILWSELRRLCENHKEVSVRIEQVSMEEKDPAMILYTSGTTGKPKGALYTHGMMFWNSVNTLSRLQIRHDDKTLMVMPPFHTGGWNVLTTPFLHVGASIILMPKFDPERSLEILTKEKISLFMVVPTMVKMMANTSIFEKLHLDYLRYMIVGGEALPVSLIETWATKNVAIRQGYGLTEAGPNITSLEAGDAIRKKGSIGFPNFYVETKLVKEDGSEALPNEQGELLIAGSVVTPGYWRNEEATTKAFTGKWFHTGDILKKDSEGYLYVVDRIKNMYISGGENVYPAEVEKCLLLHPAISEAAVVAIPDEKWGESGKAFVVKNPDQQITAEDVIGFAKERLAKFKVPKEVVFMESLPKNDTGKIDRKRLV